MQPRRWLVTAILTCGASALVACQWLVGLSDVTEGPVLVDASKGSDAPLATSPVVIDSCNHARLALKSSGDAAADQDALSLWFAMKTFSITPDGGAPALDSANSISPTYPGMGLDLDDTCTCFTGGATLHDASASCVPSSSTVTADNCDEMGNGIDNELGLLYLPYKTEIPDPAALETQSILTGTTTVIFFVGSYNGTPNDEYVTVAIGPSYGTCATEDASNGCTTPNWDGNDTWAVDVVGPTGFSKSLVNDGGVIALPTILNTGYVKDGLLVFPVGTASFFFGNMSDGFGVGRIGKNEQGLWTLSNLIVGGRVHADDALRVLISTLAHDPARCTEATQIAGSLVPTLCASRDIMLSHFDDFLGKPCDGTSLAAGAFAVQAKVRQGTTPAAPFVCSFDASCGN